MSEPSVSVVMPVFNGSKYIGKAIDSVIEQTYEAFELLIIDDGSSDGTREIIGKFHDTRIHVIKHRKNMGVSASRNEAIRLARGKYIAMHDADDISLPTRFEKQVEFLEQNPEVGLLGTNLEAIDENDNPMYIISLLTSPDDLKLAEIFSNQFGQGSVMIKRDVFKKSGLYDPSLTHAEDTDLWRRISHHTMIANLKDVLYKYRIHSEGASSNIEKIRLSALQTTKREFDYYLGHKYEYKLASFHPFSMQGGPMKYLRRKNAMYSLMSLMYAKAGLRKMAVPILMLAVIHAPWVKKPYVQLWLTILDRKSLLEFNYEFF